MGWLAEPARVTASSRSHRSMRERLASLHGFASAVHNMHRMDLKAPSRCATPKARRRHEAPVLRHPSISDRARVEVLGRGASAGLAGAWNLKIFPPPQAPTTRHPRQAVSGYSWTTGLHSTQNLCVPQTVHDHAETASTIRLLWVTTIAERRSCRGPLPSFGRARRSGNLPFVRAPRQELRVRCEGRLAAGSWWSRAAASRTRNPK